MIKIKTTNQKKKSEDQQQRGQRGHTYTSLADFILMSSLTEDWPVYLFSTPRHHNHQGSARMMRAFRKSFICIKLSAALKSVLHD